jgi:hypothetical protein
MSGKAPVSCRRRRNARVPALLLADLDQPLGESFQVLRGGPELEALLPQELDAPLALGDVFENGGKVSLYRTISRDGPPLLQCLEINFKFVGLAGRCDPAVSLEQLRV